MVPNVETDDTLRMIFWVMFPRFFLIPPLSKFDSTNSTYYAKYVWTVLYNCFLLRLKMTIKRSNKVNGMALFLRSTELNGESMNRIKMLESKQDLLKYLLTCERCIFSRIMIRATLLCFGKYSFKQIKLAKPKLLLSPNIMSNHHYRETALKKDNMRSVTGKS